MFLEFVTLLILVIVIVSPIILYHKITVSYDKVFLIVKRANVAVTKASNTTKLIIDRQKVLNEQMDALAEFVDKHSTNVIFQQEWFNTSAKADMLAARREELIRTKELKVALERLMGVALTSRQPPAPNDVLALENLKRRIEELEAILESGGETV